MNMEKGVLHIKLVNRSLLSDNERVDGGWLDDGRVAILAPNIPAMYELHFAAPMAGAVLCPINTRLDPSTISILLSHSETKVLFVDHQLLELAQASLALLPKKPILVLIREPEVAIKTTDESDSYDYEDLISTDDIDFPIRRPWDECDPITLNYTSGTTSHPKGVVYSHRGAYLNAIATCLLHGMTHMTPATYLWTVPMFHCNGWCVTWGLAAFGGTNICTRKVSPKEIFNNIVEHNVTDMGGSPTLMNMIINSPLADRKPLPHTVRLMNGAASPPPQFLRKMESMGFDIIHVYGLTETHGAGTCCFLKPEWDALSLDEKSVMKSRQGMEHLTMERLKVVKDPDTMETIPSDGETVGEVMFKGNTVMSGYYKNAKATEEALGGGWFKTGDLAVRHPGGYIQIKDRSKDIIISDGENISSVEVERVMYNHSSVMEVAVVARPDEHWGETPCAFVKLKDGSEGVTTANDIIEFCRKNLAHFMCPKTVIFLQEFPKTATGKIQKFVLKEKAKTLGTK